MQAISKPELLALLKAARAARAHSERDFLMILVAYSHGLRASEVIAIKRSDIKDGQLVVHRLKHSEMTTQTLRSHDNPLLNERFALLAFISKAKPRDRIFPITRRQFLRIVARHAEAAGLPPHKRNCHMLKHALGSEIYEKTKDLELVQFALGHKEESSSLIYSHRAGEINADREIQCLLNEDKV